MLVSFTLGDAKVPNANGFASQWNIGFRVGHNDKVLIFSYGKMTELLCGISGEYRGDVF